MLVKLLPDQISKFWDVIKYAVEQSLPPVVGESPNKMQNILASAMDGSIDVWASYEKTDKNKFEGIVLTEFLHDKGSRTNNLLIYCLYGYNDVSNESWVSGLESIIKYASGRKCNQVVAYSDNPHIIKIVKRLGGEAKYTFLSFNVKECLNNFSGGSR